MGDRFLEGDAELVELAPAPDERCIESASIGGRALDRGEDVPRDDRLRLSLRVERIVRLEDGGVLDELARRVSDEDLAGARSFLETLRDVDGVPRDEELTAGAVPGYDLARVHADADADPHADLALEVLVEAGERDAQLRRGADRAERVVLVQLGQAEDGHDRVADELLQRPTVALEDTRRWLRSSATSPVEALQGRGARREASSPRRPQRQQ